MNGEREPPVPPTASRRMYVMWSIALALLLGAGLFSWLLVVPLVRLHRMFGEDPVNYERVMRNCGGRHRACRRSRLYYLLPKWLAPRKEQCVGVAMRCTFYGQPLLELALEDDL